MAGGLAGMLWGFWVAATHGDLADVQRGAAILGFVAGLVVSYFIFRIVTLKFIAPRLASSAHRVSGESVV